MSEYNQEYDDNCYDDGRFADSGEEEVRDDYDIPTYDELDLEGRYYIYGSREDYNAWRNEQICALEGSLTTKADVQQTKEEIEETHSCKT